MMLPEWYPIYKEKIEQSMQQYLNTYLQWLQNASFPLQNFWEILQYSVVWGKRLRAILAIEFYLTLTGKKIEEIGKSDDIMRYALALEVIHSFSLIHDDLPCMDNDEYRRWQLTVWKKYGEYQAVLAGDTLHSLAFELMSEISNASHSQKLSKILSHAIGVYWMAWGQIEDLYFEGKISDVTEEILQSLHSKKTWQIIIASILGALVLADREDLIQIYKQFWENLWLAFQIKDDLLDVEWTFEETWKSVGGEKKGFVYILWIENSKNQLDRLIKNCINDIAPLQSEKLNFLVEYVRQRHK